MALRQRILTEIYGLCPLGMSARYDLVLAHARLAVLGPVLMRSTVLGPYDLLHCSTARDIRRPRCRRHGGPHVQPALSQPYS
jgi:hypothetical protein